MSVAAQQLPEMAIYEPEKTVPLSVRMPDALREQLREIADLWTKFEERLGSKRKVSVNDVILRLLEVGADNVWGEYNGRPKDEKARAALAERLAEHYNKSK